MAWSKHQFRILYIHFIYLIWSNRWQLHCSSLWRHCRQLWTVTVTIVVTCRAVVFFGRCKPNQQPVPRGFQTRGGDPALCLGLNRKFSYLWQVTTNTHTSVPSVTARGLSVKMAREWRINIARRSPSLSGVVSPWPPRAVLRWIWRAGWNGECPGSGWWIAKSRGTFQRAHWWLCMTTRNPSLWAR